MRRTWHVATNAIVVAWLVATVAVTVGHRFIASADWLMVHMLGLGAVSTAILIWSAHFSQTVRRRPLPGGRRHEIVRIAGLNAGVITAIVGMVTDQWEVLVVGAALVLAVVSWHVAAIGLMARSRTALLGGAFGWMTWYYVASGLALVAGVVAGVTMASHQVGGDIASQAYLAHTVLMLLGWVGLTVMGTLITLWPTMVRGRITPTATAFGQWALGGFVVALATVIVGTATGSLPLAIVGMTLYLLALLAALTPHALVLRKRPAMTFASLSVAAAALWLSGTVAWWTGNLVTATSWPEVEIRTAGALLPLLIGVGAQVLIGSLSHLGPVVLGGGPRGAAAAITVVNRGGDARLILINASLLAYVLTNISWVRVALSLVILGSLVSSLILVVCGAVVARRVAREHTAQPGRELARNADGSVPFPDAARPHRGGPVSRTIAALAVVAAVATGVLVDPVAAGIHTTTQASAEPTGEIVEVEVIMDDMRFDPGTITVNAGDQLVLTLVNKDDVVHDLVLATGESSGRVVPGGHVAMDLGVMGSSVDGWCSVAGHRQMGMALAITVVGNDREPAATSSAINHTTGEESAAENLDLFARPGTNAPFVDARVAPAGTASVHRYTLVVSEMLQEVAPGITQTVWAFNGSVPGPTLRGSVGDTFEVTLVNDGTMGHSIDFHAGALAPDEPMRTIDPGEALTYTFTATRAGIWMYHCGTHPMSLHIAAGMFGAVIIDPPELSKVDHEFVVVQSEWYLGPQGDIPDMDRVVTGVPDLVTFNGYPYQYRHQPWEVGVNERVRVWVLNVGLDRPSSFHVVGGQFDTVYFEGMYLLGSSTGPATDAGSQALGLLPSQGGFVEFALPEIGHYPFVSHLIVDAERGAAGTLRVNE